MLREAVIVGFRDDVPRYRANNKACTAPGVYVEQLPDIHPRTNLSVHVSVYTEVIVSMMQRDSHKQVTGSHADNNLLNSARNVLLTCKSSIILKRQNRAEQWAFNAGMTAAEHYGSTRWQTAFSSLRGKKPLEQGPPKPHIIVHS